MNLRNPRLLSAVVRIKGAGAEHSSHPDPLRSSRTNHIFFAANVAAARKWSLVIRLCSRKTTQLSNTACPPSVFTPL